MTKKTFAAAPKPNQPTAAEIAAFEQHGTGSDRTGVSEPVKRLSVDIPAVLHTRFKTACSASGRKMTRELLVMIESRTQDLEKESGLSLK